MHRNRVIWKEKRKKMMLKGSDTGTRRVSERLKKRGKQMAENVEDVKEKKQSKKV